MALTRNLDVNYNFCMDANKKIVGRRSIRLPGYDYTMAGFYAITMCTEDRACYFGNVVDGKMQLNTAGRIADECWRAIPAHFPDAILHAYVIMPNHVHGIVEIRNVPETRNGGETAVGANNYSPLHELNTQNKPHGTSRTIGSIVRGFKIGVTKQLNRSIWQRNYYEHIIRDNDEYDHTVEYIKNNPLQWASDKLHAD
jgi:REP element-mobilizing transposase RayT